MTDPTIEMNLKIKKQLENSMPTFMSKYIKELEDSSPTLKSQVAFIREVKKFLEFISHDNLEEYTEDQLNFVIPNDITDYMDKCEKEGNINSTREAKWTKIKHFFDFMFIHKFITEDIFITLKNKKPVADENDDNKKCFTKEEIQQTFTNIYNNTDEMIVIRDAAIVATLLYSGIRMSELISLDIKDVDIKQCKIHVVRKGGKKIQWVRCSDSWKGYMLEWLKYRESNNIESVALFCSSKSDRLLASGVSSRIKIVSGSHAHKFRKTFGTALYKKTKDIYLVMEALGHSSVATTIKHYANMDEEYMDSEIADLAY